MQLEDTPIQKITIRPVKKIHRHSRPKASPHPAQIIVIDRFGKSHKKTLIQDKLIDMSSKVIKISKEAPKRRIHGSEHKRKAKGPMNFNETYPIFYTKARVNGSFKDQPIRSVSGERISK